MTPRSVLEMTGIEKAFAGVKALDAVDFRLLPGEVHALMGENGAGKSTLMKVLTGAYEIDGGRIELQGERVQFASPQEAQRGGVSAVYQEVNLCPNLSVAENISIGREPHRFGRIQWRAVKRRAVDALARVDVSLDVAAPLSRYSIAVQQMVAIARAHRHLGRRPDPRRAHLEPRPRRGPAALHDRAPAEGAGHRHRLHLALPRPGVRDRGPHHGAAQRPLRRRVADQRPPAGRARLEDARTRAADARGAGAEGEAGRRRLRRGDAGRRGAGARRARARSSPSTSPSRAARSSASQACSARVAPSWRGCCSARIVPIRASSTSTAPTSRSAPRARRPRTGVAFCPENRRTEGLVEELTVRENIILALQAGRGWTRPLPRKRQSELVDEVDRGARHPARRPRAAGRHAQRRQPAEGAAGPLAPDRAAAPDPRRADAGHRRRREDRGPAAGRSLCEDGMSVLFISAELEEVLRLSHKIAVLRDRQVVARARERRGPRRSTVSSTRSPAARQVSAVRRRLSWPLLAIGGAPARSTSSSAPVLQPADAGRAPLRQPRSTSCASVRR